MPDSHLGVLTIDHTGKGSLCFYHSMQHKLVELLRLAVSKATDEVINDFIAYRFNLLKGKLTATKAVLDEVSIFVRERNPVLYEEMQEIIPNSLK